MSPPDGAPPHLALRDRERLADWTRVANDWYWEADADLRITYVSPSFAQSGRDVEAFMRIGQPGGPHFIEDEHWAAMREDLLGPPRLPRPSARRALARRPGGLGACFGRATLMTKLATASAGAASATM